MAGRISTWPATPPRACCCSTIAMARSAKRACGAGLNEDGMEQAGMGVAAGDFELTGNLGIFKTHFADDTNILYRNDGKAIFEDVTARAGLGVETRYIGWGAGIEDLDNDGLPDLCF